MAKKEKIKILIVDDDKFLLDMYALKFGQSGFAVTAALSAAEALEKIRQNECHPEVILTDVLMPEMDGFTFLERLQSEKLVEGTKIIVLSNKGEKYDIDKGVSLGADGYIVKASMIPSEVVEKVRIILEKE
jgi:DNA-binding response OmpR family regulator